MNEQTQRNARDTDRTAALDKATRYVAALPFKGEKLFPSQENPWPRTGVFRDDGTEIADVPPEIVDATYFVAACYFITPMPSDFTKSLDRILGPLLAEDGTELLTGTVQACSKAPADQNRKRPRQIRRGLV